MSQRRFIWFSQVTCRRSVSKTKNFEKPELAVVPWQETMQKLFITSQVLRFNFLRTPDVEVKHWPTRYQPAPGQMPKAKWEPCIEGPLRAIWSCSWSLEGRPEQRLWKLLQRTREPVTHSLPKCGSCTHSVKWAHALLPLSLSCAGWQRCCCG